MRNLIILSLSATLDGIVRSLLIAANVNMTLAVNVLSDTAYVVSETSYFVAPCPRNCFAYVTLNLSWSMMTTKYFRRSVATDNSDSYDRVKVI